jgi:Domain of unknown function (DUF397)
MTAPQSTTRWRKATRSVETADCVEVGNTLTALRDSKNPGPVLPVNVPALLAAVKEGRIGI